MFELDINKIKEQSMQFVDTAYKAAMDIADKGKNQLDLASQQNRLAKAQRQLGALVYSLHKADEENQPLVDKYIENIAEIEKAIEEIKARMTPDEAAAAEAAEAEQEAEDPNDPTTYHDDPAGLTPEEEQALADAAPDGLILPFAENYRYLAPLLENRPDTQAIAELGRLSEARRTRPAALAGLTPRELELADLLAQRLTNREIAGRLGLSEGSVKQYLNQLYAKLHIDGDTRRKRQELAALLKQSG